MCFDLALETVAKGLRTKSKKKMEEADALLRRAADAGNAEAIDYLENLWPALKKRAEDYK